MSARERYSDLRRVLCWVRGCPISVVRDVVGVLGQEHPALAIVVDEVQDLDDELMGALLAIQHEASQQGWPSGGLPTPRP